MTWLRSRFEKSSPKEVMDYTSSLPVDWRLYRYDIQGSIAHARMLAKQHIITSEELDLTIEGLEQVRSEIEDGEFSFSSEMEDIHMAIEARLIEIIGETGGKLHTARSRNDQIALDLRLFVKDAIRNTQSALRELQSALINLAVANEDVVMPGYTHLQPAQPVLLAHHLLAYFEMLERDFWRFENCLQRVDVMPLGSGALAGVTYDVDREFLAKELGFSTVSPNSLDAVSDRDFVVEYEAAASLSMMHLSRLAEEMVLWCSQEFAFIELDDAYATTSSIMPQKKNPDVAELVRGKTGRVYGHLVGMLTVMKGLPLAYNRDLQEDKEGLFDTVDTLVASLHIFSGMISSVSVNKKNMRRATERGYILATDLADYLVKKGESFRQAHQIVAALVSYAERKGISLEGLSSQEYHQFSPRFDEDVYHITVEGALASRDILGGTAPEQVHKALQRAKKLLERDQR